MGNCLKRFKSDDKETNKNSNKRMNDYVVQDEDEQSSQNTSQVPLAVPPQQQAQEPIEKKSKPQEQPKQEQQPKPQQEQQQQASKPLKSWEVRRQNEQKYSREHYRMRKKENETIIREPGTLEGNAIAIAKCVNCNIYILDHTACVTIDDCQNCNIFIAPSVSSVFVRDCKNSKFMICCGQFRSRDCVDLEIGLFCQSQPVIESSVNMQFFCFQYTYEGFKKQFDAAKLNVWKNNWSDIYDFTPNKSGGGLNYSYLGEDIDPNEFLPLPSNLAHLSKSSGEQNNQLIDDSEILESIGDNDQQQKLILKKDCEVPISTGKRLKEDPSLLLVFKPEAINEQNLPLSEQVANKFNLIDNSDIYLKRSTVIQLESEQACELCLQDFISEKVLFVHIGGTASNLEELFMNWLSEAGLDAGLIQLKLQGEEAIEKSKIIFENWNDVRK